MKNGLMKFMTIIVVGLLVLIIAAAVLINIYGDAVLKAGVETGAGKAMKVDVTVNDISLAILAGKLNINKLVVDNPEGYANPTFLELGHAFAHLKIASLLGDPIEIETIQLDNVHLTVEQKGLTSNLKEILNNLPKAERPEEEPPQERGRKKLLIKQLDVTGVQVTIKLLPVPGRADNLNLELSPIHMENIGSEKSIDTPELVSTIILAIAGGIAQKGAGILPTEMLQSISGQLTEHGLKILDAGKNVGIEIIEGGGDIGGGILEGGRDIGKEATETLKGLNPFQKKEEE